MYTFTWYAAVYLFGSALSAGAAVYAFRSWKSDGAHWLFWMVLATSVWSAAEALDYSSLTLQAHIFAAQVSYFGATTAPLFYLLFALEYCGNVRRVPKRVWIPLLVPSAIAIAAAFTNAAHHLVWPGFAMDPRQPYLITYEHGPIYWAITIYGLIMALAASLLLISLASRVRGIYQRQSIGVVIAAIFPWVAELSYSLSAKPLPGFDPAMTLALTGTVLVASMSQFRLLDLVPVSRELLVDEMTDGVVVLDPRGRVLEVNPAASRLLGLGHVPKVGTRAREMFADWPAPYVDQLSAVATGKSTILLAPNGLEIGVDRSVLHPDQEGVQRDLFMLRDVTGQMQAERALLAAYDDLQSRIGEIETLQNELREQATRDHLTGLYNRRFFADSLERELSRAAREGYTVSFLMFDVDHFKEINDHCGHLVGDEVLRVIGAEMRCQTRAGDVSCRYGGDEFVAVLPKSSLEDAAMRAQQLRRGLREKMGVCVGNRCAPTISVGVASFPMHGSTAEEVLIAVDTACYAAKAGGRDRVAIAQSASDREAATVGF